MKYSKDFIERLANEINCELMDNDNLVDDSGYLKEDACYDMIKDILNKYL